jgi:hypothetical protein
MNRFALRDIVPDLQDRAEAQMDAIVRQIRG